MVAPAIKILGWGRPAALGFKCASGRIGRDGQARYAVVCRVDAVAWQALAAGAKELRPVKDQFYGDRTGSFEDPFGHVWHIATHKEELTPDELKRRSGEAMQRDGG